MVLFCVCVCVHSCEMPTLHYTCRYLVFVGLRGTMGVIDCGYTVLSIAITAKVALQLVKNDLSIPSHKRKHTPAGWTSWPAPIENPSTVFHLTTKHFPEHQSFDFTAHFSAYSESNFSPRVLHGCVSL